MNVDHAMTSDNSQLKLPAELLAEVSRRKASRPRNDFHVENLKPSLFGRLAEKLFGKSSR